MKRRSTGTCLGLCFGVCALLLVGGAAFAQPDFELSFSGQAEFEGLEGSAVSADYTAVLAQSGDLSVGAQGWSMSVSTGGDLTITGITTDGTVAADVNSDPPGLRNTGFEKSEITETSPNPASCPGGIDGAVSAVVLSFTLPITLPTDAPSEIAIVSAEATIPPLADGPDTVSLVFLSGCQGSGQPVENNITWEGQTILPDMVPLDITLTPIEITDCCDDEGNPLPGVTLIFQDEASGMVPETYANDIRTAVNGADCKDESVEANTLTVEVKPSDAKTATVYGAIVSNLASGVQGWSMSVATSGDVTPIDATTAGTVGADVNDDPPGLRNTGFEKTEIVDPNNPDAPVVPQGEGAVSAVVLSFTLPITLEPAGTATVIAMTVEATREPADAEDIVTGEVFYTQNLKGSGQPVATAATVDGSTADFCEERSTTVAFVVASTPSFLRGNANGDMRYDIADAIWTINELYRGGPPSSCPEAGDSNGDGMVDLSDAVYTIMYQFEGGPAPAAPFPDCGDGDPETCASQDICL